VGGFSLTAVQRSYLAPGTWCRRPLHTGRRFQFESTLQDIKIGQICRISMSRWGANYLLQGGSTISLKWTLHGRCGSTLCGWTQRPACLAAWLGCRAQAKQCTLAQERERLLSKVTAQFGKRVSAHIPLCANPDAVTA
jgi:hypothetical protein